ncbi:MAG: patatin-like phospholipase family protein, partial [Erysipelotrichaceae bacterium]|nr:patatin-like phospholipase family protein [Erysipelotrichaceae bacterium]
MKKALVMAGGGTRGAYQAGAIKALIEMGRNDWNIVTGTSVGALNACLVVQKDYDKLFALYDNLSVDMILNGMSPADMNLRTIFNERDAFIKELRKYVKDQGLDIS